MNGTDSDQEAMEVPLRRLLRQRLSTQVVIMMVAILVVTLAAGFAVVQRDLNRQLNQQYEYRSLAVAQALASQPGLQQAVLAGDPGGAGPHVWARMVWCRAWRWPPRATPERRSSW